MALSTGTNTIKLQVIDDSNGDVKAEVNWFHLNPEQTMLLERTILEATLVLGEQALQVR